MKISDITIKPYQGALNKRFTTIIKYTDVNLDKTKTINFGLDTGFTYYDGANDKTRLAYIARHSKLSGENWSNPLTAGYWSRWFLWETRKQNINTYIKKRFSNAKITFVGL